MQPAIRRAVQCDAGAVSAMQEAAYRPNRAILGVEPLPLQVDYADIIRDMDVWLFSLDGVLAGALVLKSATDHLLVWSVATHPDVAARGLGRNMMAFAESEAARQHLAEMRLYTGSKLADRIGWYQRLGYQVTQLEDLPDRQITHMAKRLALPPGGG